MCIRDRLEELRFVLKTYAGPEYPLEHPPRHRMRGFRPVLVAAVAVAALAGAGAAIADGIGAFNGISAAQHPQTGADVIDPATQAYMECESGASPCTPIIPGLLFNTARVVGQIPSGQNIYVVTTTSNSLCFIVGPPHPLWNCDDPLSRSHPVSYTHLTLPTILRV